MRRKKLRLGWRVSILVALTAGLLFAGAASSGASASGSGALSRDAGFPPALAGVAAAIALGAGAPAEGRTPASQMGGGVSGSFGDRRDAFLSFSITGGNLELRPGTAASYEGAWTGGPITLSGEMTVARSAGSVSYVTMTANLADKSWSWPPPGGDGKVTGRTVTQRYTLTFNVPANYAGSVVSGSAMLEVCGGTCGTYKVDFAMTVKKRTPPSPPTKPKPKGAPKVQAFPPRAQQPAGPLKTVTLEHSVEDDSGKATVHLVIYEGGTRVMSGSGTGAATGARLSATIRLPKRLVGPLFFCVWAEDAEGNRSAGSPKSSCAWIPFLVSVKRVSNGCGGEGWDTLVKIENYFGNEHTYVDSNTNPAADVYTVSFVDACDLHDAGYAGVMVKDRINGGVVDYRTWSRKRVDDKFYIDMLKLCNTIPPVAKVARAKCKGMGGPASIGARRLHGFVRKYGWHFFDADLTMGGVQSVPNYRARPKGGARSNFDRK